MLSFLSIVLALAGTSLAADFPANPLAKPGYTLEFHDEFDGPTLDTTKWLPHYLPHWVPNPDDGAKARYTIEDGCLIERIDADTPAWNPKYDRTGNREAKISSIQTYDRDWWHRFNNTMPNDHHVEPFQGYTPFYGYIEVRAKMANVGGGGHQAVWLVGVNDTSPNSRNPEIDFIESFFATPNKWRIAGYGWGSSDFLSSWTLYQDPVPSGNPTEEFHLYAMDWRKDRLDFYYDNKLYKTIPKAPQQPMGIIMGIYTDAGSGLHNDVWPKKWSVDYIRVWKDNNGY